MGQRFRSGPYYKRYWGRAHFGKYCKRQLHKAERRAWKNPRHTGSYLSWYGLVSWKGQ